MQSNGQKALDKQTKKALKNKTPDSFLSTHKNSPKTWKSPVVKKNDRPSVSTRENNASLAQGKTCFLNLIVDNETADELLERKKGKKAVFVMSSSPNFKHSI